jgi:hypothetical protein
MMATERSILHLARGGLPLPHRLPTGEWCYRHTVAPTAVVSALDVQAVIDFCA